MNAKTMRNKMFLYHYFDKKIGPFISLSDIPMDDAKNIINNIKTTKPDTQCATRQPAYMERRHEIEEILKREFVKKGGHIKRKSPYYMIVEHSPWLATWFENSAYVKIPIEEFNLKTVSFTYGDAFPVFSDNRHKMDDKEYRRKIYIYDEILDLITKYGLPQNWNNDGLYGPERYIEAHVWCDEPINKFLKNNNEK